MPGATGSNAWAGIMSSVSTDFNVVKAIIEAENIIRKEGNTTLTAFKRAFGETVSLERQKEHLEMLNKVIEIDFPEVEISDADFEKMSTNIEVYKCLELIRKTPKSK